MFKDVLRAMDFTLLSQLALVLFFGVFIAVVVRTLLRPRQEMDSQAAIPLSDKPVEPRGTEPSNHE